MGKLSNVHMPSSAWMPTPTAITDKRKTKEARKKRGCRMLSPAEEVWLDLRGFLSQPIELPYELGHLAVADLGEPCGEAEARSRVQGQTGDGDGSLVRKDDLQLHLPSLGLLLHR